MLSLDLGGGGRAALVLLAGWIAVAAGVSASGENSSIEVAYVNCSGQPNASELTTRSMDDHITRVRANVVGSVSKFEFGLPGGLYSLRVTSGRCVGDAIIGILKGENRFVPMAGYTIKPEPTSSGTYVIGHDILSSEGRYALAGTLPLGGLSVSMLDDCDRLQPVVVEGNAFYADQLFQPGEYVIEVRGSNFGVRLEQKVSEKNTLVVRDVTLSEVLSDAWLDLPRGAGCP